jgi:transcriptional regulator with XRE-family HTH domain
MIAEMSERGLRNMVLIGSSLREERRRRGLDLAEVEAATLIRARYLEALEQDRFDLLPLGSYRRTFLREYAEFLGLGGDTYLDEFDKRLATVDPEPPAPPRRSRVRIRRPPGELRLTRTAAAAAAIVVLIGLGIWQLGESGNSRSVQTTPPPTQTNGLTRARTHHHHHHQPVSTARSSRRTPPPTLTLTAIHGSCWLLVRIGSSAGRTVYEQSLQPGHTLHFGLRKQLWVRLGAPQNLTASIAGRAVTTTLRSPTGNLLATRSGFRPSP